MFWGENGPPAVTRLISVVETNNMALGKKLAEPRPFDCICYKQSGETVHRAKGAELTLGPGQILFIPAGLGYSTDKLTRGQSIAVHFSSAEPMPEELALITPSEPEFFNRLFTSILGEWRSRQPGSVCACVSRLYSAFAELEREEFRSTGAGVGCVADAVSFINGGYTSPELTVAGAAGYAGVSEAYLRRRFTECLGVGPKRYIDGLRLRLASELLESGYYTISEVAAKCGYRSVYHFSKLYKQKTGAPPTGAQHRRQTKNEA